MSSTEIHEGGCSCGTVRYQTIGQPARTGVCHCRYCQTRTGPAFGISVYFLKKTLLKILKANTIEPARFIIR